MTSSETAPETVPVKLDRREGLLPVPLVPTPWSALPGLSTVAARAFGHRARHRRARSRLHRGVHHVQDAIQLCLGLVLYPVVLLGLRASPWTEVYASGDRSAVLDVVRRRARTGRRGRPAQWTVYDVAAWPYGTGAGRRLLQGLQVTAASKGVTLRLKATDALVERLYGPLGFTPTPHRHWYVWTPPRSSGWASAATRSNAKPHADLRVVTPTAPEVL